MFLLEQLRPSHLQVHHCVSHILQQLRQLYLLRMHGWNISQWNGMLELQYCLLDLLVRYCMHQLFLRLLSRQRWLRKMLDNL